MTDLGPLTTLFAAPATCTASTAQIYQVWQSLTTYQFVQGPLWTASSANCFPDLYEPSPTAFYSPGYCPAGYTAACSSVDSEATLAATAYTCCPTGLNYTCAASTAELGCTTSFVSALVSIGATVIKNGEEVGITTVSQTEGGIGAYSIAVRIKETDPTTPEPGPTTSSSTSSKATNTGNSSPFIIIAPSPSSQASGGGGIGSGEAIGIGVGSAAFVILVLTGIAVWYIKWRRRKLAQQGLPHRSHQQLRDPPGGPTPSDHFSFKSEGPSQQLPHHYVFSRPPPSAPGSSFSMANSQQGSHEAGSISQQYLPPQQQRAQQFQGHQQLPLQQQQPPPRQQSASPPPGDGMDYDRQHNYAMNELKLAPSEKQATARHMAIEAKPFDFRQSDHTQQQAHGGAGDGDMFAGELGEGAPTTIRYELPQDDAWGSRHLDPNPSSRRATVLSTSTYSTSNDRTSPAGSTGPFDPPPSLAGAQLHRQELATETRQEPQQQQQQQQGMGGTRSTSIPSRLAPPAARGNPWPLGGQGQMPLMPLSPGMARRSLTQPIPNHHQYPQQQQQQQQQQQTRGAGGSGRAIVPQTAAYHPIELEAPMASPTGTTSLAGSVPSRKGSPGVSNGTVSYQSDGSWRMYGDASMAPAAWL